MAELELLAAAAGAGVVAADTLAGVAVGGGGDGAFVHNGLDLAGFGGRGIGDVGDLLGAVFDFLGGFAQLFAALHLDRHQHLGDFVLHRIQQLAEQFEGFALVLLLGLLLRVAAQVYALAQVVQRAQVFAPVRVYALQQHHALEAGEILAPDLFDLAGEAFLRGLQHHFQHVVVGDGAGLAHRGLQVQLDLPFFAQHFFQAGQVPLLFHRFVRHVFMHQVGQAAFAQRVDLAAQVLRVQDVVALLVDHLALVVGHVVVFQQLLADIEVAGLDLALRRFNAARDDASLDGLALGHLEPVHDGLDAVTGEDAHQRVVQAQVEARRARVALAAGTPAQLVVNAARLMAFGGDDAQAALGLDQLVLGLPGGAQLFDLLCLGSVVQCGVSMHRRQQFFQVAAEHDIGTAAGHVGGDGDHLGPAGLGHDLGFARMLLGVQNLVRQLFLLQQLGDDFRVLDRGRAHQHRLAALVTVADVVDRCLVFFLGGLVDAVELVVAAAGAVRRHHHGFQAVDFLEFIGLGIGRAGHAGELGVEAEVVLEGDRGQGLVLGLDRHAFLGLDGLVQTVAPAPAGHQAAGELVNDDDFRAVLALLHHVMLVAVVQVVGPQRRVQVVHQADVGRVVQRGARRNQAALGHDLLGTLVAVLGQVDLVRLLVHGEITRRDHAFAGARIGLANLLGQQRRDGVDGDVHGRVVFGLTADDQRRARFVDQDRVHFVDDAVVQPALHPVCAFVDHVVTQVVEAVFVVGAVGDVGLVRGLLLLARHVGQVDADAQTQEVVQLAHPLRVAVRQVVVHGDHVHALAGQRVQVDR